MSLTHLLVCRARSVFSNSAGDVSTAHDRQGARSTACSFHNTDFGDFLRDHLVSCHGACIQQISSLLHKTEASILALGVTPCLMDTVFYPIACGFRLRKKKRNPTERRSGCQLSESSSVQILNFFPRQRDIKSTASSKPCLPRQQAQPTSKCPASA